MKSRPARRLSKLERQGRVLELALRGDVHAAVWLLERINLKGALEMIEACDRDTRRIVH